MEQQLEVSLTIPIPADSVLIKKVELEELRSNKLEGVYWSMKDLEERVQKKGVWIRENILYQPRFRKELEKFVHYPKSQGEQWTFHAKKMAEFLDKNFKRIFN